MYTRDQSICDYTEYIEEHVSNVKEAWNTLFKPYLSATDDEAYELAGVDAETLNIALQESEVLASNHDGSKYDEEEFEAYRIHFYPTQDDLALLEYDLYDDQEEFARAFAHHCSVNPHHAQYWIDDYGYPKEDMPLEYVIEMICDWEAMSMKFGGSTREWWEDKAGKERGCMTENTIALVDRMMGVLFD